MISDDDLLLYYYRELDAEERARIGAAVSADPELARRLHAMVARLDSATAVPEVPVPAQVQERWRAALDRAATQARVAAPSRRFSAPLIWQAAAAAVTVFALIFSIQRVMQPPIEPIAENPLPVGSGGGQPDATAYANGLKFHLASTERRIASLGAAAPEDRARLIETIIGQNRMYALAAERAGEPQLARVLRAFDPILEGLADGRSGTAAADVAQLGFELRVMQARLGAGAAPSNTL